MAEVLASTTPSSSAVSSPPSSPLTMLSQSPSPPSSPQLLALDHAKRYPSPSTTSQSTGSSPRKSAPHDASQESRQRGDGPPPAKKRRVQPPRPRMTRHIDLDRNDEESDVELNYLLRALRTKKKIVVVAGAGISVSAGIPDFRSSTGLFTTLRGQHGIRGSGKHLFDASVYKNDSSTESFHSMVRELSHMTEKAKPTPFHELLASLASERRLLRLYSQNIDCIDTSMEPLATQVPLNPKAPWPVTIQLHGGLEKMVCSKCGQLEKFDGSLFEGPEPPPCKNCAVVDEVRTAVAKRSHGIGRLRPRIVLYNEYNPDEEAIGNVSKADLRRRPDAVIVAGTSLKIPGVRRLVKELCQVTRSSRHGLTAWINVDAEPQGAEFKDCWDYVVRGSCDDVAQLTGLPRWDQQELGSPSTYMVTGDGHKHEDLEVVLDKLDDASPVRIKTESGKEESAQAKPTSEPPCQATSIPTSIPTPIPSPKPGRKRLPSSKPATGAPRQSKLPFQLAKNAASSSPGSAGPRKEGKATLKSKAVSKNKENSTGKQAKKAQHPKIKKEAKAAANNMPLLFRATKHTVNTASAAKEQKSLSLETMPRTPESSRSHDVAKSLDITDFTKLPSLRDEPSSNECGKEDKRDGMWCGSGHERHHSSSPCRYRDVHTPPPASPPICGLEAHTISPNSKPRGMGTLID